MAATVSVPSANGQIITYTNVFNTPQNLALAQQIEQALFAALAGDPLNAQIYSPPTTPPAIPTDVNELVVPVSLSGGTVFTPAGYTFVADSTGGGSFTVVGAQNFIGGNGNITVWDTVGVPSVGGGLDTITAGDGNDLFGLTAGTTYDAAGGNGNDTYVAAGSGTVAGGTGSNLFFVDGGSNLVLSFGHDEIIAAGGASTIATHGSGDVIFGGSGDMDVFGTGATNLTVGGSITGPETIFGAQSGIYFFGSSTNLFIGNPSTDSTIVGSTSSSGSQTVFGGASSHELIFNNSSSLLFVSGSNDSTTIVGGSSPSTLFGSAGSSITFFSTSSAGGALFGAGIGNETLNASGSSANVNLFGGNDPTGGDKLIGGAGNDTLTAGSGGDTMTGGKGDNVFAFFDGSAGGHDLITDFGTTGSSDKVLLANYGLTGPGFANVLATATTSNGGATISLPDNTKITFEGVSAANLSSITFKLS
jgi:Ca2+-binding RTX toxin-like protein